MHVVYIISYLPHIQNNTPPFYYVGSKCNYNKKRNYLGSLSSVQYTWYSDDIGAGKWWAKQKKEHPEYFEFKILEEYDESVSAKDMTIFELEYHNSLNVLTDLYFNFAKATRGFCGCKRSPESKLLISEKTRSFWKSDEGQLKKSRLSKRNSLTKSHELKEKWQDPAFIAKMASRRPPVHTPEGLMVLSDKMKARRKLIKNRMVEVDGVLYDDAIAASVKFGIDAVNVRRRCRMGRYPNWKYV